MSDFGLIFFIFATTVIACAVRFARAQRLVNEGSSSVDSIASSVKGFCVATGFIVPFTTFGLLLVSGGSFRGSHGSGGVLFIGLIANVVVAGILGEFLARKINRSRQPESE